MLSDAARRLGLGDHLPHVLRREELALLDVDRLAGARNRLDEIGLPAQERGRLQHVDDRGRRRDLVFGVHVGQHRHGDVLLHVGEHAQAFFHAGTAKRRHRAAIRLVVRRLEDERNAEIRADDLQLARHVHLQLPRFDDARPCDEEQRTIEADVVAAELHARCSRSTRRAHAITQPGDRRRRIAGGALLAFDAPRGRSSRTADGRGADST